MTLADLCDRGDCGLPRWRNLPLCCHRRPPLPLQETNQGEDDDDDYDDEHENEYHDWHHDSIKSIATDDDAVNKAFADYDVYDDGSGKDENKSGTYQKAWLHPSTSGSSPRHHNSHGPTLYDAFILYAPRDEVINDHHS